MATITLIMKTKETSNERAQEDPKIKKFTACVRKCEKNKDSTLRTDCVHSCYYRFCVPKNSSQK